MEPCSHDGEEREGGKRKGNIGSHQSMQFSSVVIFPMSSVILFNSIYFFTGMIDKRRRSKQNLVSCFCMRYLLPFQQASICVAKYWFLTCDCKSLIIPVCYQKRYNYPEIRCDTCKQPLLQSGDPPAS